jgi:hypothetical protein
VDFDNVLLPTFTHIAGRELDLLIVAETNEEDSLSKRMKSFQADLVASNQDRWNLVVARTVDRLADLNETYDPSNSSVERGRLITNEVVISVTKFLRIRFSVAVMLKKVKKIYMLSVGESLILKLLLLW